MIRTKTFIENRWYRRLSPGQFAEIPEAETGEGAALDAQISEWVERTGNIIIHPGQLGMHTSWHGDNEDPFQVKCITLGLTLLYEEASDAGEPATAIEPEPETYPDASAPGFSGEPGGSSSDTCTGAAQSGGDGSGPADGPRPAP